MIAFPDQASWPAMKQPREPLSIGIVVNRPMDRIAVQANDCSEAEETGCEKDKEIKGEEVVHLPSLPDSDDFCDVSEAGLGAQSRTGDAQPPLGRAENVVAVRALVDTERARAHFPLPDLLQDALLLPTKQTTHSPLSHCEQLR